MPEEPSEDGEMNQGNETALSEALKKQHGGLRPSRLPLGVTTTSETPSPPLVTPCSLTHTFPANT